MNLGVGSSFPRPSLTTCTLINVLKVQYYIDVLETNDMIYHTYSYHSDESEAYYSTKKGGAYLDSKKTIKHIVSNLHALV